ncbi:hypothetical protein JNUCC0626_20185 [Lentzea sp. JNUCC 0626]|uniref:hypothetical protein n=1 Tax=Lentzea sp. JNUCC 0626 TaxID=3367513 RepID=UPI0037491935
MSETREARLATVAVRLLVDTTVPYSVADLTRCLSLEQHEIQALVSEKLADGWLRVARPLADDQHGQRQGLMTYRLTPDGESKARKLVSRLWGHSAPFESFLESSGLSIYAALVVRAARGDAEAMGGEVDG